MNSSTTLSRVIISGGGTGGHIFPALAIANAIRKAYPLVHILFVGAEGRMEMQKVPEAGYEIIGLPIAGIQRSLSLKNLSLPYKLYKSLSRARKLMKSFQPQVVIGVGGYASGPTLFMAQRLGIPTLIQEQNSYAGLTNKWLAKNAATICVAYDGMERFFPKTKIVKTGNPIRSIISQSEITKSAAALFWRLDANKTTVLIIGGSLGARTINQSIAAGLQQLIEAGIQIIWQTGKAYFEQAKELTNTLDSSKQQVLVFDFIKDMDQAYAVADIVVSRAGALSVSELSVVGKAAVLVPSPNVAEDHQTQNALALTSKNAAILVKDANAQQSLVNELMSLIHNVDQQAALSKNIKHLAIADADSRILQEIEKLITS